jgi:hypothetical protein
MTLKVSTATDVRRTPDELVELPFPQCGKKIVLRVKQLNMDEISLAQGGPPAMAPDADGTRHLSPRETQDAAAIFRAFARAGIVEPRFIFDPVDADAPGARWDDLSAGNQAAAVEAIQRLSGLGVSKDVEAAKRAAGFPAEPGRKADGAPVAAPLSAGAAAA